VTAAVKPPTQIPMERLEIFLRKLAEQVSVASENNLTPRCWKPSTLCREIKSLIKSNQPALRTTFPAAHTVVDQLERMGWIHPVRVQSPLAAKPIDFLLLNLESGRGEPIYPLELLQAYLPSGVVSYFSAINYYELTTQVVTHHHVVRLDAPKPPKSLPADKATEPASVGEALERNPLGTEIFQFEAVGYYQNRRDASLVPGIQVRVVSPRCWLRITTLEQTLLDALLQPIRCGGEAVVLEAWETGARQMDTDRMAEHLAKIQRDDLDRRVGAMLEMLEVNLTGSTLALRLKAVSDRLKTQRVPEIPLLPGLEFLELNQIWQVRIP